MSNRYDLIVIGAGAAGSTAAKLAARQGRRVALVERDLLGGTCLNYGCDPTKALLHAATLYYEAKKASYYGLNVASAKCSWEAVKQRVRDMIDGMRGGTNEDAADRQRERGIDVYLAEGSFESPDKVRVGEETIEGDKIIIATGYVTSIPPIEGIREAGAVTNQDILDVDPFPETVAIIGAGPIGTEFSQIFSRFGASVTIFEMGHRILMQDDAVLSKLLAKRLIEEGIKFQCGVTIKRVESQGLQKRIVWDTDGEEMGCSVDLILVASGRKPAIEKLGLDNAGVEYNDRGIVVDGALRTNVPHIFAAGDVTGFYPFTHVAAAQVKVALHNAFSDEIKECDYTAVPWVTYTYPPLAHAGRTEEQLQQAGQEYSVLELDVGKVPRNIISGETFGKIRILVDNEGTILGAHMLGARADEMIALIVAAMRNGLTAHDLASLILPYPTYSQAVQFTAGKIKR